MQSGWHHNWIKPRQSKSRGTMNVHAVIPGGFDTPRLLKASPFVISAPSTSAEYENMTSKLRTGIPDPWAEYLAFSEICGKRAGKKNQKEYQMHSANLKITKAIWQRFGVSLDQGIPDPSKSIPRVDAIEEWSEKVSKINEPTEIKMVINNTPQMQSEEIQTNKFSHNFDEENTADSDNNSIRSVLNPLSDIKNSTTQTEHDHIDLSHNFPINSCKFSSIADQDFKNYSCQQRANIYCITLKKDRRMKFTKITSRLKQLLNKFMGKEDVHKCQTENIEFQGNFDINLVCYRCNCPYFQAFNIDEGSCVNEPVPVEKQLDTSYVDNLQIQRDKLIAEFVDEQIDSIKEERTSSSISTIASSAIDVKTSLQDILQDSPQSQQSLDSFKTYTKPGQASRRLKNYIDDVFRPEIDKISTIKTEEINIATNIKQEFSFEQKETLTNLNECFIKSFYTENFQSMPYNPETFENDETSIGEILSYHTEIPNCKITANDFGKNIKSQWGSIEKKPTEFLEISTDFLYYSPELHRKKGKYKPQGDVTRSMYTLNQKPIQKYRKSFRESASEEDSYYSMSPRNNYTKKL